MTEADADRVIAKLRSGAAYGYESYAAQRRESLYAEGEGFRNKVQIYGDPDRIVEISEAQLREMLGAGKLEHLLEWVEGG